MNLYNKKWNIAPIGKTVEESDIRSTPLFFHKDRVN